MLTNIFGKHLKIINLIHLCIIKFDQKKNQLFKTKENFPICMTTSEINFFIKAISSSKKYLEFGAGGSTCLTLLNSDAKIYSVENDPQWINKMKNWEIIKHLGDSSRLSLEYINIGNVGKWGIPTTNYNKSFPNYSNGIFNKIDGKTIDTVLVDGRFRVACILSTILNCKSDVDIIVHDFWNRPKYHLVLNFLDVIDSVDTICKLRKKQNIDYEKVATLYGKYKYIWD